MKLPATWDEDTPITLDEACKVLFRGTIKPATLVAEADRGKLHLEKIGRRYFTTPKAVQEMREKCARPRKQAPTATQNGTQERRERRNLDHPGRKPLRAHGLPWKRNMRRLKGRLADYLARKYEPPTSRDPHVIAVADILNHYVLQHCPTIASGKQEVDFIKQLVPYWGSRMLYDVDAAGCRDYAASRIEAGVSSATARREIETLRAATRFYVTDRKVQFLPSFWLPEKGAPRERWMTRSEVAAFLHAARRRGNHHLARVILIGILHRHAYRGDPAHALGAQHRGRLVRP